MSTTPMILIQALAVGLGGYCLILWFQKARKPVLIGFHLIAGIGGVETLMVFLHNSDFAQDSPVRALGMTAAKLFGASIFTGFLAPLVGKGRPQLANLLLTIHVGCGVLGFMTALNFAGQV